MKLFSVMLVILLLGTMFLSLFHMSTSMEMVGSMTNCPLMSHEAVVCPMSIADHIGTWKALFTAISPAVVLLLTGALFLIASVAPNLLVARQKFFLILPSHLRERTYTFRYRILQEIFSSGILHPKVF